MVPAGKVTCQPTRRAGRLQLSRQLQWRRSGDRTACRCKSWEQPPPSSGETGEDMCPARQETGGRSHHVHRVAVPPSHDHRHSYAWELRHRRPRWWDKTCGHPEDRQLTFATMCRQHHLHCLELRDRYECHRREHRRAREQQVTHVSSLLHFVPQPSESLNSSPLRGGDSRQS